MFRPIQLDLLLLHQMRSGSGARMVVPVHEGRDHVFVQLWYFLHAAYHCLFSLLTQECISFRAPQPERVLGTLLQDAGHMLT